MLLAVPVAAPAGPDTGRVAPSLVPNLVSYYDFDHPAGSDESAESDLGRSRTPIRLVNGGAAMRVGDAAYPGAGRSLQTKQVNPDSAGNDDWKAGIFDENGVATLSAFNAVPGITLMGWVKPTGAHPNPDSTTPASADRFSAVGLFGLLSGTSQGHLVRALLEVIEVSGSLRLVALGRREDDGGSLLLAASDDWESLLPDNTWTHLAASFDYDEGTMALYRDGEAVDAEYTGNDDPWQLSGDPEPDVSSATDPGGIKIGGSYPQNTIERNPFNGRFDDLMFFNRVLTPAEVQAQFERFGRP